MDIEDIKKALTGEGSVQTEENQQENPETGQEIPQPSHEDGSDCRVCGKAEVKDGVCQHCGIVQHIN